MRVLWVSKASVTASYRKKIALLARRGLEMGVVTGDGWGPWKFESAADDSQYALYRVRQRLSGRNHFHWYRHLASVVRQFKPDLLHIDEEHYSTVTFQSARIAEVLHVPFIFQTWQNIFKRYPLPFSAMERYVFAHAQAAVAGTAEIQEVLMRQGFDKPIHIVPLGVDTDLFYPDHQSAYRARFGTEGRWAIGYIGRLVPEKGVLDLADAVVDLLIRHPDWLWVIAGSGPLQAQLSAKTDVVKNQVRLVPWLTTEDMTHLMNALDVLVVPSRTTPQWKEQFGRVLVEAMAVELPVIAYDSGEIPQVVQSAGILVPEGRIDLLAQEIVRLSDSPALAQQLKAEGLSRVLAQFSQVQVATKLQTVYGQIRASSAQGVRR